MRNEVNILFLSAAAKTPLLFSFRNAYKALSCEGSIIAVDSSPYAVSRVFADKFFLVPRRDDPLFLNAIKTIIKNESTSLIVPTAIEDVVLCVKYKKEIESLGARILVCPSKTVELSCDKEKFFHVCNAHKINTPKVYDLTMLTKKPLPFPLFVNSRSGKGSQYAHKAETQDELQCALARAPLPMVMEYIKAPEYSIDCFADFDGNIISIVPRRRLLTVGGESSVTVTEQNEFILSETKRLLEYIPFIGPLNIQCFFQDGRVVFFEINARFGGASRLAFEAGAETPLLLLRIMRGEKVLPRVGEFKDKFCMLRFKDDVFMDEEKVRQYE